MEVSREEIIQDIKTNFAEIVAGFCVLTISLMLLFLRITDYIIILIGFIGCVSVILIGLEKRAASFDRVVAMLVVLILALGFMLMR